MSGTYRRRSDPSQRDNHGIFKERPESPTGSTFGQSNADVYNKKSQEEGRDEERRRDETVDRKNEFEDFSSGRKAQTLLEMINQKTEEAFGDPASEHTNEENVEKGEPGGLTPYQGYRPVFENHQYYDGSRGGKTTVRQKFLKDLGNP